MRVEIEIKTKRCKRWPIPARAALDCRKRSLTEVLRCSWAGGIMLMTLGQLYALRHGRPSQASHSHCPTW